MFSFFGFGKSKIKNALKKGAAIIDVRTAHEYDRGKVPGSVNIPLDRLSVSIERIKSMNKPIIVCCESGMRSSSAKKLLIAAGVQEVYNGGSWESVLKLRNQL